MSTVLSPVISHEAEEAFAALSDARDNGGAVRVQSGDLRVQIVLLLASEVIHEKRRQLLRVPSNIRNPDVEGRARSVRKSPYEAGLNLQKLVVLA